MFGKWKKKTSLEISSPVKGEVIELSQVNDPVFASGVMGPGFVVIPEEGKIFAPLTGEVATVFPTKHAILLKSSGVDLLIHMGIDTVELAGKGFEVLVEPGQKVQMGTLIATIDLGYLIQQDKDPVILTLLPEYTGETVLQQQGPVAEGTLLMNVTRP